MMLIHINYYSLKHLKVISYKNGNKNKCDKNKEQANKEKLKIAITFFLVSQVIVILEGS